MNNPIYIDYKVVLNTTAALLKQIPQGNTGKCNVPVIKLYNYLVG